MASTIGSVQATIDSKQIFEKVKGSLAIQAALSFSPLSTTISDINIGKFLSNGYESKLLTNKVLSVLAGLQSINVDSDNNTIDNEVIANWSNIFSQSI